MHTATNANDETAAPIDPLSVLPPLSETEYTRESLLAALSAPGYIAAADIARATVYAAEIEPDIVALIERARREELDEPSAMILFRGIHILGGRRFPSAYRPLAALLREASPEVIDDLLGAAITEALPAILAGLFDGDPEPLLGLIADIAVDEFVRNSALQAYTFLTFDARIGKAEAQEFLARFERENRAEPGDYIWDGWMSAVALLGFDDLTPRVLAAFADGRIPRELSEPRHYYELLAEARRRPGDASRFESEHAGYIGDVLEVLERYSYEPGPGPASDEDWAALARLDPGMSLDTLAKLEAELDRMEAELNAGAGPVSQWEPYHNPYRAVGRNDPCPCGSGKKFKKCCGA